VSIFTEKQFTELAAILISHSKYYISEVKDVLLNPFFKSAIPIWFFA
jgi:hypothetical protein